MYVCIYRIYVYTHTHHRQIYIYIERERESEKERGREGGREREREKERERETGYLVCIWSIDPVEYKFTSLHQSRAAGSHWAKTNFGSP